MSDPVLAEHLPLLVVSSEVMPWYCRALLIPSLPCDITHPTWSKSARTRFTHVHVYLPLANLHYHKVDGVAIHWPSGLLRCGVAQRHVVRYAALRCDDPSFRMFSNLTDHRKLMSRMMTEFILRNVTNMV